MPMDLMVGEFHPLPMRLLVVEIWSVAKALDSRLESMERHLQELRGGSVGHMAWIKMLQQQQSIAHQARAMRIRSIRPMDRQQWVHPRGRWTHCVGPRA